MIVFVNKIYGLGFYLADFFKIAKHYLPLRTTSNVATSCFKEMFSGHANLVKVR